MTNLDLLKKIYHATISLPIKQKISSENKKSVIISSHYSSNPPYCKTNENATYFNYFLNNSDDMRYVYNIEIYKTELNNFLKLFKKERYILIVKITKPSSYNLGFKDEYFFDSKVIGNKLLKDIFDFLNNRNDELINSEVSEKFQLYCSDLSKVVDKSVTREELLNNILNQ